MQTSSVITRRDISRYRDQRLRGVGAGETVASATPWGAIAMAAMNLTQTAISYWRQQSLNNANKVKATNQAEGFVSIFWGSQDNACSIKVGDQAVWQYHEPEQYLDSLTTLPVASPRMCESSVGGLIERCRLAEAYVLLQAAQQDARTLAGNFSYFANWYYQYGMANFAYFTAKLSSIYPKCISANINISTGTQGATTGDSGTTTTTPPASTGQIVSGIPNSALILGGIGLLGLFVYTSK